MDAVTSNGQQQQPKYQHHRQENRKPDPLAHVAARIGSLSREVGAMPLWTELFADIVRENFRLPAAVMYDFVNKCPKPVNGGRNIVADFVERHWSEKVLRELADPKVDPERMARRFNTHVQLANFASAEAFLKARVDVEGVYAGAGVEVPAEIAERIAKCDGWRFANGGYTMEQLVAAGFKRSVAEEGLYKDPITGAAISLKPRRERNDRRARPQGATREERDRNAMLSTFDPERRQPKKHKEIPVLSREEQEANRIAKINGRNARRDAARKAAAQKKQDQKAAKKAAGEKKGGKRAQGGK